IGSPGPLPGAGSRRRARPRSGVLDAALPRGQPGRGVRRHESAAPLRPAWACGGPRTHGCRRMKVLGPDPKRLAAEAAELRASSLFDEAWYCARYPDVPLTGIDPAVHFLRIGAQLRRMPSPHFDTGYYLDRHPDVARSALNPLLHYIQFGIAEGRSARAGQVADAPATRPSTQANAAGSPVAAARGRRRPGTRAVLACAHSAPSRLYGGERSFLDIVAALDRIG